MGIAKIEPARLINNKYMPMTGKERGLNFRFRIKSRLVPIKSNGQMNRQKNRGIIKLATSAASPKRKKTVIILPAMAEHTAVKGLRDCRTAGLKLLVIVSGKAKKTITMNSSDFIRYRFLLFNTLQSYASIFCA